MSLEDSINLLIRWGPVMVNRDIIRNAREFNRQYKQQLIINWTDSYKQSTSLYLNCYRHGLIYQSLRSIIGDNDPCSEFLREMQTAAVSSFAQAMIGQYRSALSNCRSILEHCVAYIFFSVHPIEYLWWCSGEYPQDFKKQLDFILKIDNLKRYNKERNIREVIIREYKILSRSVHGHGSHYMQSFNSLSDYKYDRGMIRRWSQHYRRLSEISAILIIINYPEKWHQATQLQREIISEIMTRKEKDMITTAVDDKDFFKKHL